MHFLIGLTYSECFSRLPMGKIRGGEAQGSVGGKVVLAEEIHMP